MSNKDHKNTRSSRSSTGSRKGGGGGMMAGILVGLIVGVGIAIGVSMYLSRSATPFTNMERLQGKQTASVPEAELLEPGAKLSTATPPAKPATNPASPAANPQPASAPAVNGKPATAGKTTQAPADVDGQRFDFYKILPGQQEAVPSTDKGTADTASGSNAASQRFFLQAGAFQSESDADNMKARLALMGVEAKIQSLNMADKGLLHRVRIGPFERQEDMDAMRARLRQEGIEVSIVKLPVK
ncbi:SPOR domain-containing protein [Vogesella sp. LIG4]|uniref:SPOR domain-containing protein n=1 Tax=Vogesella sp. LIG4 TaxID=1192162 RepID=UPI00081FC2D5|nr:SPOR domain-containing protein [Vogesella sp. LIG4]SCK09230.1 cell division protein FtsN [Vogesella sp. LIG4]